jgi:hypothetical protein
MAHKAGEISNANNANSPSQKHFTPTRLHLDSVDVVNSLLSKVVMFSRKRACPERVAAAVTLSGQSPYLNNFVYFHTDVARDARH